MIFIMKMTNLEAVRHANSLNGVIEEGKELPVKLSYAITKNLKRLLKELETYEEERQKIIGKEDSEEKLKELCDIEIDVDINTVQMDVIEQIGTIAPGQLMALDFMIAE